MKNGGGSHIDYYTLRYLIDRLNGSTRQESRKIRATAS
jgi:hypothetical protein